MKKLYYDRTENTDCVSIFVKDAKVIPAGTTVSSMSIKSKNEEYRKFSDKYDIHFIFDDNIPEIDFYAVPQVDIFAFDSKGGFFAAAGGITDVDGTEPVCYIDNNRKCFIIADCMRNFLESASCWRKNMVPDKEIAFFPAKKEAEKEYEFIYSYEAVLNRIAGKYQKILGDKLIGIYVHGSIAFGCFHWETSDIDFIVVIKKLLTLEEKEELIQVLLDLEEAVPPKGLEMSVVLDKYCNPFVYPTPFELHFSNMHKESCRNNLREYCREMQGTDKDLAAHFTVILTAGRALCGADITSVFGKVPRENYLDSIMSDIEDAVNEIQENPVYIILNLCRVLAFAEEGSVISKERGGKWGIIRLPEIYRPLIKKALMSYRGNGIFTAEESELKGFAEYMLGRIQAWLAMSGDDRTGKFMMAPLWLMYPNIPEGSIGWRMGYGENYAGKFWEWYYSLPEQEKKEFNRKFPKPICWELLEYKILRHDKFWTFKWNADNQPEYSVKDIEEEVQAGIKRERIFFWGHHPKKEGIIDKSCLSQWYMADFYVGHIKYCCMEQYMMSKKAELFGDINTRDKIMNSGKQEEIKQLGREVTPFDSGVWNQFKRPVVLTGNYYKFAQLPELRQYLLDTGEALLAEASPYDRIWGIGLSAEEAKERTVSDWKGQNLLGFALMEVRDELNRLWKYAGEINFESLHEWFD